MRKANSVRRHIHCCPRRTILLNFCRNLSSRCRVVLDGCNTALGMSTGGLNRLLLHAVDGRRKNHSQYPQLSIHPNSAQGSSSPQMRLVVVAERYSSVPVGQLVIPAIHIHAFRALSIPSPLASSFWLRYARPIDCWSSSAIRAVLTTFLTHQSPMHLWSEVTQLDQQSFFPFSIVDCTPNDDGESLYKYQHEIPGSDVMLP